MFKNRAYIIFIVDLLILVTSFLICIWIKPGSGKSYFVNWTNEFVIFLLIWTISSFFFRKYSLILTEDNIGAFKAIIISNIFAFALVTSLMYVSRIAFYSRMLVIGTIGVATTMEILFGTAFFALVKAVNGYESNGNISLKNGTGVNLLNGTIKKLKKSGKQNKEVSKEAVKTREKALLIEISKKAFDFIFSYAKIDSPNTLIISTTHYFNIDAQLSPEFECIVNIERINDIRYINKFFESANARLPAGGLFIDFVETKNLRKQRILRKYPPFLNFIFYLFDYIIKRIFPKFLITKKIYFFLTRGQNRVLTKAETFGRLYSCGFEVIDERYIDNYLFFIARKTAEPLFPKRPTYGPLVKLDRIGKKGKIIRVYKMRTMHPYAEYLQDYVYKKVGLDNGGKFKNDFRVSSLGRFMRIFWIDELPMLINLFKGDLKLFGVRPLSLHYFNLYSKELQKRRIKYKPGLIPPFYADKPETLEEIMSSEIKYLDAYDKHPFFTDFKYFFRAIFNIIFKKYRSK
jgi:lipopolysaccharide/colanic/teichoic acid biosynthesis glycosyltransferase